MARLHMYTMYKKICRRLCVCICLLMLGIFLNEFNRKLVYVELIEINCQNSRILETVRTKKQRPFAVSDRRYLCVFTNVANVRVRDF